MQPAKPSASARARRGFRAREDIEIGHGLDDAARIGKVAAAVLQAGQRRAMPLAQPHHHFGRPGHFRVLRNVVQVDRQSAAGRRARRARRRRRPGRRRSRRGSRTAAARAPPQSPSRPQPASGAPSRRATQTPVPTMKRASGRPLPATACITARRCSIEKAVASPVVPSRLIASQPPSSSARQCASRRGRSGESSGSSGVAVAAMTPRSRGGAIRFLQKP